MIINSLLDLDMYKLYMGSFINRYYPDVDVKFRFISRGSERSPLDCISDDDLMCELNHVMDLRFQPDEIEYLRSLNIFEEDYLSFLRDFHLPRYILKQGNFNDLSFSGKWKEVTYWETIALSIVSELYWKEKIKDKDKFPSCGYDNLFDKIDMLARYPDIKFMDFGTRRRFSHDWQDLVLGILKRVCPNCIGTSNVYFAKRHDMKPMGTMAHELFMVAAAIGDKYQSSFNIANQWAKMYPYDLRILLTDTFGSDLWFGKNIDSMIAPNWARDFKGFRQDSGDPFIWGENALSSLENMNKSLLSIVDLSQKTFVFSDNLDLPKMIKLYEYFHNKVQVSFGWGTNLTNDMGIKPLSIVVKVVEANGNGCVKLSDDPDKATGRITDIEEYKKIFNVGCLGD